MKTIFWCVFRPSGELDEPWLWHVRPWDALGGDDMNGDWFGPILEATSIEAARRLLPSRVEAGVVPEGNHPNLVEMWA